MVAGDVLGLNSDGDDAPATTLQDLGWYAGLVLVGFTLAVWLGTRARSGTPDRLAKASLGFALASAVTFIGFWSGWPHIFAAVGVALSLEYRRRVGAFSGITMAALLVSAAASSPRPGSAWSADPQPEEHTMRHRLSTLLGSAALIGAAASGPVFGRGSRPRLLPRALRRLRALRRR